MNLKFSIVTPSYNQGEFIKECIESVLSQNFENFEHIIIDAGSTDSTIDILKEYKHLKWISEPDSGPAEAISKGFKLASGNIFSWLNSDDYYDKDVFNTINEVLSERNEINFLIGNLTFVNRDKEIIFADKTHNYTRDYLLNVSADVIRQPCSFFSSDLYIKSGGIDKDLKLVFDYDLFIRFLNIVPGYFIEKNFVFQRDYPETLSRRFVRRQAIEIFKVSRKNGGNLLTRLNRKNLKKYLFNKL